MGIKDPDVRKALETLQTEIENYEYTIKEKDEEISDNEEEYSKLEVRIEELEARVKELEEALAEAYLTDEVSDEFQGEDAELQTGCGTDVSDSAGN
jgi:predicted  nucleic acid-binding Zn-ribbon protein